MEFKKCARCGNFFLSDNNVCPKCLPKDRRKGDERYETNDCIRYPRIRILLSGNAGCDEKRMPGQTVTSGRHPVSWTKK